jgi:hypothetical protein
MDGTARSGLGEQRVQLGREIGFAVTGGDKDSYHPFGLLRE